MDTATLSTFADCFEKISAFQPGELVSKGVGPGGRRKMQMTAAYETRLKAEHGANWKAQRQKDIQEYATSRGMKPTGVGGLLGLPSVRGAGSLGAVRSSKPPSMKTAANADGGLNDPGVVGLMGAGVGGTGGGISGAFLGKRVGAEMQNRATKRVAEQAGREALEAKAPGLLRRALGRVATPKGMAAGLGTLGAVGLGALGHRIFRRDAEEGDGYTSALFARLMAEAAMGSHDYAARGPAGRSHADQQALLKDTRHQAFLKDPELAEAYAELEDPDEYDMKDWERRFAQKAAATKPTQDYLGREMKSMPVHEEGRLLELFDETHPAPNRFESA